jgi:adenosylcobinamide-GDP ribazoletransferase
MLHELRLFFIALQFLTRVPVPRWVGFEPAWLNASARYFPAAGTLVGAVAVLVLWVGSWVLPMPLAVGLSMVSTLLLTGCFHEDGLADTCDALGGHVSRARALELMKDSRIGTYGTLGLMAALGLKAAALMALIAALPMVWVAFAVLLGHTASRAAAVVLIRCLPYAADLDQAKAKPLAQQVSRLDVCIAISWVLGLYSLLLWWQPACASRLLLSLLLVAAGTLWSARWLMRRLGGYTGDTLGATQQVTELLVLLCWAAKWDAFL